MSSRSDVTTPPEDLDQSSETAKQSFDVFLCHNSRDKPAVEEIESALRERGLRPWLDVRELRPGLPWRRALEAQIKSIGAAAVFVGAEEIPPSPPFSKGGTGTRSVET